MIKYWPLALLGILAASLPNVGASNILDPVCTTKSFLLIHAAYVTNRLG